MSHRSIAARARSYIDAGIAQTAPARARYVQSGAWDYKDAGEFQAACILRIAQADGKAYARLREAGIHPDCPRASATAISSFFWRK